MNRTRRGLGIRLLDLKIFFSNDSSERTQYTLLTRTNYVLNLCQYGIEQMFHERMFRNQWNFALHEASRGGKVKNLNPKA